MKKVVGVLLAVMFFFFSSVVFSYTESDKEPLFEMNGKKYYLKDLSISIRNLLYEAEFKNYQITSSVLDQVLLDKHFEKIAASKKMTVDQVMEKELKVSDPTEKEVKKFYEEQRAKIPSSYKYEDIKAQLKQTLVRERVITKRSELLAKLKKQHKFKSLISEPMPVVVNFDTTGFSSKGDLRSKVNLTVFGSYGCVHCKHLNETLRTVLKKEKVKVVFVPFLLSAAPVEEELVKGGFCADKQNKFWQYLDLAFKNQRTLSEESVKDFAKKLKLDMSKYDNCLGSDEVQAFLRKVKDMGNSVDISATPTIFINNKKYLGSYEALGLEEAIERERDIVEGKNKK